MPYNENTKKSTIKYIKEKQKQLTVRYKISDYTDYIAPAIEASGMNTTAFIKKAVSEKIERDGLLNGK